MARFVTFPVGDLQREGLRDVALSAMLAVQFFALFVAAPLGALGLPAVRPVAELLLVAYVVLAVSLSRSWVSGVVAAVISAVGLVAGVLNLLTVELLWTTLVAHSFSIAGFIVLGSIVAHAVFAPGPVNTHRVLGAIVLYLNLALFFSTAYRMVWDFFPDAFSGLPDGAEGHRGFAAVIYYSFVTLTSTGYGDVLPVNPLARSLANLESVLGQLYPATVLAWLIAQHLEWRRGN